MRPRVISARQLASDRVHLAVLYPESESEYWRPKTRADCVNVPRPCPYVSCRYNLYLDIDEESGALRLNYQRSAKEGRGRSARTFEKEVWELEHGSCSLDIAAEGDHTLEQVADIMGLTRERIRQIQSYGGAMLRGTRKLDEFAVNPPRRDDEDEDTKDEDVDLAQMPIYWDGEGPDPDEDPDAELKIYESDEGSEPDSEPDSQESE